MNNKIIKGQKIINMQEDQCGKNYTSSRDPGYQAWFVRNHCTLHAVSKFTQYFPYILLFLPLCLVGIERFFNRLFSSDVQIEGLSYLISASKRAAIDETKKLAAQSEHNNVDDTIKTVEVRQSFKDYGTFYKNYMFRTVVEFIVSLALSAYIWLTGMIEIQKDLKIICKIHNFFYECSGVPTQFYLYILVIRAARASVSTKPYLKQIFGQMRSSA